MDNSSQKEQSLFLEFKSIIEKIKELNNLEYDISPFDLIWKICIYQKNRAISTHRFDIQFFKEHMEIKIYDAEANSTEYYLLLNEEFLKSINLFKKFLNMTKHHLVMFGGSFNPITIAHYSVAKAIVEQIKNSYVVFVPTSIEYIKHHKHYNQENTFGNYARYSMLTMSTLYDANIIIDDLELKENNAKAKTFRTMFQLQNLYGPRTLKPFGISCIIGTDDIPFMNKWWNIDRLLDNFSCIVVNRKIDFSNEKIQNCDIIKEHDWRFKLLNYENKYSEISSTLLREQLDKNMETKEQIEEYIPYLGYMDFLKLKKEGRLYE